MRIPTDCAGAGSIPFRAPDRLSAVTACHSTHSIDSIACSTTRRFIDDAASVVFSDSSARPTPPL